MDKKMDELFNTIQKDLNNLKNVSEPDTILQINDENIKSVTEKTKIVIDEEKENKNENGEIKDDVWGFFDFTPPHAMNVDGLNVYFEGIVNSYSMNDLISIFIELNKNIESLSRSTGVNKKSFEIKLFITSPGGSVMDGFRFIDMVKSLELNVSTIACGTVASMGFILWLLGENKYIMPHSHLLIHQISTGIQGNRNYIKDYIKHLDDLHNQLTSFIAENTQMSMSEINKLISKETWLTAEECVNKNLCKIYKG